MPKRFTKQEIEAHQGEYDQDGFYILKDKDGEFFDPEGYHFNKQGFDGIGGYYDDNGQYVAPPGLKDANAGVFMYDDQDLYEYADYYDELVGDSDEEEDESGNLDEAEVNQGVKKEHVLPVFDWLKDQPQSKKYVIKIANLPRQANE